MVLCLQIRLFLRVFMLIFCVRFSSFLCLLCEHFRLIFLDVITVTMHIENFKLWIPSLCLSLNHSIASSLLSPVIFLSILFSNTIRTSLRTTDQVPHPYKAKSPDITGFKVCIRFPLFLHPKSGKLCDGVCTLRAMPYDRRDGFLPYPFQSLLHKSPYY